MRSPHAGGNRGAYSDVRQRQLSSKTLFYLCLCLERGCAGPGKARTLLVFAETVENLLTEMRKVDFDIDMKSQLCGHL